MHPLFEFSDKLNNPCECFACSSFMHSLPVPPHFHYFIEIIYVTEGSLLASADSESYVLSEGDMIVFLPSMVHALYATSDAPCRYEVLKFDPASFAARSNSSFGASVNFSSLFAAANAMRHDAGERSASPEETGNIRIFFSSDVLNALPVAALFFACLTEMEQKQYGYQALLHAKIQELLTYILRFWRADGFNTDALYAPADQYDSIYSITEYIDRHLGDDLRAANLAARCNMSYSYFAKNFREVYGQSCKKYMESMRLSKVEDMLLFTSFDLSYISQETGFSDCSHLIHAFKEKYGVTPHQYRMRYHV